MRLLYQRAVTQRCSSGTLSALAVSCNPQSLKRSAQTSTWQMGAVWLPRHRHSFWLCCTSMGGRGSSSRQGCQPAPLKDLFSNNWTCFLTYTVRISMGLDWLHLGRLERELFTCLKCSVWDKLKPPKVPRRRRVGRDFVDTSDYISTRQLFSVCMGVLCMCRRRIEVVQTIDHDAQASHNNFHTLNCHLKLHEMGGVEDRGTAWFLPSAKFSVACVGAPAI